MKVYIAGHNGMVGSAIEKKLKIRASINKDFEIVVRSRNELDLCDQAAVREFFRLERPDAVIIAAAKVGGILANSSYPAEFIYQNLMIECNLIHESYRSGVSKLLFLGSSCIYPRLADQPMLERSLLTGTLEPTNEPYAIAKIAGIKLCESYNRQYGVDYRSVMPTNLYGPGDNFHPENSHVVPALIHRFHQAKLNNLKDVVIWGTGSPLREFLHVDDMASGALFILDLGEFSYKEKTSPMTSHINIGSGVEVSIYDLANMIKVVVGYDGDIIFDVTKPDGTPRKLMDSGIINSLGWTSGIGLKDGLEDTYAWYLSHTN